MIQCTHAIAGHAQPILYVHLFIIDVKIDNNRSIYCADLVSNGRALCHATKIHVGYA